MHARRTIGRRLLPALALTALVVVLIAIVQSPSTPPPGAVGSVDRPGLVAALDAEDMQTDSDSTQHSRNTDTLVPMHKQHTTTHC